MSSKKIKVLYLMPGEEEHKDKFIFAKNFIKFAEQNNVEAKSIFIGKLSRISGVIKNAKKILETIKEFNPDIVHAQFGSMVSFLGFLLFGRTLFVTFRGSDINMDPNMNFFKRIGTFLLSHISTLRATKIFCVSDGIKDKIIFNKAKVTLLPTGLDFSLFKPMEKSSCRLALNLPNESKIILFYSGNNRPLKRKDLALEVYNNLKAKFTDSLFVELKGDTSHKEIPLYINAADCTLLTSDREGSPNIVKESLACGTPVVAFDVGDVRKWISKDPLSSVVENRSLSEMTKKAYRIFEAEVDQNRPIHLEELDSKTLYKNVILDYERARSEKI